MSCSAARPPWVPSVWFVHAAWRVPHGLYRLSGGRFLWTPSNRRGWGALRLATIGRKPGVERRVIVGYLEVGPNLVALAMNGWVDCPLDGGWTSRHTRTPSFVGARASLCRSEQEARSHANFNSPQMLARD